MRDALLRATAALVCRRPRTVVAIGLLLAVVSAAYAGLTLRMNANTDDLIGSDRPYFADYRRFLDEFGDLEHIYVVVVDDGRPERVWACVDEITRRLRDLGELPGVHGAIEPAEQTRLATRVMPEASLAGLADAAAALAVLRETDDARTVLADATARLERLTGTWTDLPPETQRRLGASAVLLLEVVAGTAGLAPPPPEPLRSDTGRLHFVIVEPEKDFSTLAVIEEPLARIRAELDAVRAAFPGLEIGLTGRPVLQADEMTTTTVDMTRASIIAVVIVSGLFMIVIGGVWRPVLAVVALMCGVAWTFGLAAVTVGQLNLLSIVFAIVLVGIGIDFGVHLVARFLEHRRGHDAEDAVVHTLRTAGRGNLTGAVTSSLAFFMAMFTSFQGLRELGFIAGAGLLLCLVSMSTVLPALLLLADARLGQPKAHGRRHALLEGHPRLLHRLPGLVLGLVAVATLAGLPALRALGFEENLLELQAEGLESVRWEHRILDDSVAATWFGAVTVDDLDAIGPVVGAARERPGIGAVRSVLDIVAPPSVRRAELRAALHAVPDDAAASSPPPLPDGRTWDAAGAVNAAEAALDRLIVLAAAGDRDDLRALADLKRRLAALTTELASPDHDVTAAARALVAQRVADAHATAGELLAGDALPLRAALPGAVRSLSVSPAGRYLVRLHPGENVWEYEPMERFVADLRAVDPRVTGAPITHFESLGEMKDSFVLAALLALAAVVVLVAADFRHLGHTALALIPVLLGLLWTVEAMGLLGIGFNLANFFSVPILIGIGIDNGVHLLHRWREGTGAGTLHLGSTRRAAILTSLTTMVGFGCLATATHRGLQSLGLVMALGAAACLVASIVVLPAILAILETRRGSHAPG